MTNPTPPPINSPAAITQGLAAKTVAVVGLSSNPTTPSYAIAQYLQEHGYRIIPVNPQETAVLGEQAYPSVQAIPERVDVVDVFRRADAVPAVVEDAIAAGAPLVWLQLGIRNEAAAARAQEAGLTVVMDHCMKVEHHRRAVAQAAAGEVDPS
ncbi:MAG: CoA-binding protein [Chloroflexota bacterium]|nr:CoA-binding protein [Chloroflexota bacterium]